MPDLKLVDLGRRVTGRPVSLFREDFLAASAALSAAFAGRRILLVGAAGSIGGATLRCLLEWGPAEVLLVDTAENNLVETLREIRSDPAYAGAPVAIEPIDFGSPMMEGILRQQPPFDWVFNFAAVKHVRSERDVPSLFQMVDTNLLKADRFLGWVRAWGHGGAGTFFVSSDKAANPANLMGASKRIMEQLLFWHGSEACQGTTLLGAACSGGPLRTTTARFANVAFSDGSLLHGWLHRLAKGQPLAGPSDIRRYFVTLEEAGQICTLAAVLPAAGGILVPRLSPAEDLRDFKELAELVVRHHGYEPRWHATEAGARLDTPGDGFWPCFFSPSETMGEKPYEEFAGQGEVLLEMGLRALQVVGAAPNPSTEALSAAFAQLRDWRERAGLGVSKRDIARCMAALVPTLQHRDFKRSLDLGM